MSPAVPLAAADKYVAAAYLVAFALVLVYVVIMATRLARVERELAELNELAARPPVEEAPTAAEEVMTS